MKYTIEDWKNGKCALKWEQEKKEKILKLFKTHVSGLYKFYIKDETKKIFLIEEL